ncbi:hypothetical protein OOK27_09935 [Streptomyces canus]|uniref:hypothetical protein n=1 Tax=Streptomyces canus TaxID=58343 RepID=UPI00224DCF9B|nr:hypothetical protein [Streptomyces canus]MCX5254497.1 hypothetical protein [Streptomyces canus]
MQLRCRIPTVQAEVRLVKQATPAWRRRPPDGLPGGHGLGSRAVRRHERQADPLAFVCIAAALIGYGRLTA